MNPEKPDLYQKKKANLKVGDVLLATTKTLLKNEQTYTGVISADGVISKAVALIPKDSQHGANVLTRSCLFRIENARKVNGEIEDSELSMALGKSLTYGERVQLRHWHSKGFLSVNPHNIALEVGCLEIYISDGGNEDSWFEILPVNKLKKPGEVIKYSDSLYLKCSFEKSGYFLHFSQMGLENFESKTEINACGNSSSWKLKKYMNSDLMESGRAYVPTGDSFRIFHKISEGYLSVSESFIITDEESYQSAPELSLFVQKGNKSSNSLWELQRLTAFVGGIARWEEDFRIKHLATGQFLAKENNTLRLTSRGTDASSSFRLVPQSTAVEKEIRFGAILSIHNLAEILKVEYQGELTTLTQQKSKEIYQLSFVQSKKDYSTVAFVLEDIPEVNTAHVYKLSLMIPKLVDAYSYLKNCDMDLKTLAESPNKENVLKQTCAQLHTMLENVRKYVLHSNTSEVDVIKRQNSMREMGIIDALVKLADVLQYKIESSRNTPMLQKDLSTFSYKSADVAGPSIHLILFELVEDFYQLIYDSIKNNPRNCESLMQHEDIIMPMLSGFCFQKVGKILREMLKFVLELSKYSEKRVNKWFQYLQNFKLSDGNICNQNMYLSMMKYLCQANGVPSVTYQAKFKEKLFVSENSSKIIKFHICNGRACIELDYIRSREKLSEIIGFNKYLSSLELVRLDELIDLNSDLPIFYLEDLCRDKNYSKYVSSAIDLYTSLCLGRFTSVIDKVKKELNASPEYFALALSSSVNLKLKAALTDLLRTVVIDVDPYVLISQFRPRCFAWITKDENMAIQKMDKKLKPKIPEFFFRVANEVMCFWRSEKNAIFEDLSGNLKIVTSHLRLTKVLIDLEVMSVEFIIEFQKNLLFLIMHYEKDKDSWCNELVSLVRKYLEGEYKHSLAAKLSEMLEEVMDTLGVMIIKRENLHIEDMCRVFFNQKIQELGNRPLSPRTIATNFEGVLLKLDWKIEFHEETLHLDIHLLDLLFNSDKTLNLEVRKKALELILADLNIRNTLKKELDLVEFLTSPEEIEIYVQVYSKSVALSALLKDLITFQVEAKTYTYDRLIKETSEITAEVLEIHKSQSQNPFSSKKFQSILRHTNIFEPLIAVLSLKTDPSIPLYRNSISLLNFFAIDCVPNQELLLKYVNLLLSKINIGQGVTKLIAQVLSRNTQIRKENRVIKLIFESIDQISYEYHLLQLLRTFVYDENQKITSKMQIDILKWIFNNGTIKNMHRHQWNHYDYLCPNLEIPEVPYKKAMKFHLEVMKCINVCIAKNRFGILQGRKLITLNNLFKKVKNKKTGPLFKKTYLKFLFDVYMDEIPGAISPIININALEEILQDVIIPDLDYASRSIEDLVKVASKGWYQNICCKNIADFKRKITARELELADGSEEEVLDFWNYLSGKQSWHSEKDGLLHILRDIFLLGGVISVGVMTDLVDRIRVQLKNLSKSFEEVEKNFKNLDCSTIIFILNACREVIPTKRGEEEEEEDVETNEKVKNLVFSLREAILDRKLSLEEVFSIFDSDKSGNISKSEFKSGIKCLLKTQFYDLETCFSYFAVDGVLRLSEFSGKLRKYFFRKVSIKPLQKSAKKDQNKLILNPDNYLQNNEIIDDFEKFKKKFFEERKDQDLDQLVSKIRDLYVDPAIQENNHIILKEFVSKLGTAFKKKIHKIYLLKILKLLIPTDLKLSKFFDEENASQLEKLSKIRKIQEILSKSGVLELALTIISSEHELELVEEAVQLIISLLKYGNQIVQTKFLEVLKQSDNSYLFSYIRLKLRQSRDRIVDKARRTYEKAPERAAQGRFLGIILEQNAIYRECAAGSERSLEKPKHVESLILLLQLCCENCYSEFQHFIRSQETYDSAQKAISINMVNEISQYLINIKEVGPELIVDEEALLIIPQCFETLTGLCRGPCVDNQLILGQRRKLYKFINSIILEKQLGDKFLQSVISFLKVLLEGNYSPDIAIIMIEEIDFKHLAHLAFEIYSEKIHNNRDALTQENIGQNSMFAFLSSCKMISEPISSEDWEKINCGFDIVILFLKLQDKFPESAKLKSLSFNKNVQENSKSLLDRIQLLGGRQESLYQGVLLYIKGKFKKRIDPDMDTAYEFYLSFLASVEIDRDGTLEQSYFKVPAMIMFLSENMRNKMMYELNRNSHEEKVKSIFQHSELCQLHMYHLQQLSKFKTLTWWSSKYKSLADITFIMIVLVNLILLFSISSPNDQNFDIGNFPGQVFITIFGVILIIISIAVYLLFIIENYPIILYEKFNKPKNTDIYNLPSANKLQGTVLIKYYAEATSQINRSSSFLNFSKIVSVFLFPENIYNLFYIILVCIAWKTVFVYPFILLDIVRRNENLRNILKAVTQNKRQLGLTMLLGLIIVYLFGVVGFLKFAEYYSDCESLLSYVVYTLYYGIRAGGGIGDQLTNPDINDSLYGFRQLFDILFFILVIIVLLNIIFGIIIDTFGELRDKRKKIEEDIENICIICSREKYEFELRGSGWNEHTQLEHNLFSYLAYIINVRRKPISECNGLESFVKFKISDGDVSFIPKTAMCLEKGEQDEQDTMFKEINHGIRDIENLMAKMELMVE